MKDRREYLDNGMDDAISKPLAVQAMQAVIDKFFVNRIKSQKKCYRAEVVEDVTPTPSPVINTHLLDLKIC